ncbi:MAG: hypothetical protein ACRYG8_24340 [Janthinobacterium lividum]
MNWGPYRNQIEARSCLEAFSEDIFKQYVGLIWSAEDDAIWLRPPLFDSSGQALSILARCDSVEPVSRSTKPTAIDNIERVVGDYMAYLGRLDATRGDALIASGTVENKYINEHVLRPVNEFISKYEYVKDGITVVMDAAGVIAGGAAALTLATAGGGLLITVGLSAGVLAGLASLCLLVEDGRHGWFTMQGDEAGKLALELTSDFHWIEAVGPLLAIPDLAISGRAALREAGQLADKLGRVRAVTAAAAAKSQHATTEFRNLAADAEQSSGVLAKAADDAARRARNYREMTARAKEANLKLIMAREGVTAYGGTLWGSGLYAYDPPPLAKTSVTSLFGTSVPAIGGLPPSLQSPSTTGQAVQARSKDMTARSSRRNDNPWRLLDPDSGRGCAVLPPSSLKLTAIVTSRPKQGLRR